MVYGVWCMVYGVWCMVECFLEPLFLMWDESLPNLPLPSLIRPPVHTFHVTYYILQYISNVEITADLATITHFILHITYNILSFIWLHQLRKYCFALAPAVGDLLHGALLVRVYEVLLAIVFFRLQSLGIPVYNLQYKLVILLLQRGDDG